MQFLMTDSERVIMVSYKCFMVSFRLSYTVSEILRFSCKTENDVINISPLGGAVHSSKRRNLEGH